METTTPTDLKIYHVKSYPTISPSQPSLSTRGKTVIIAGVSHDHVGLAIARSFAESGAMNIALMGESESILTSSTSDLKANYSATKIQYFVTDARSSESVAVTAHHIRASLGAWDVFVQAVAHSPVATTLVGADTDDWWACFEQNVRSTQHFAKHFIPKKRPNATYISLVSRSLCQPVDGMAGSSAFVASQSALLKVNHFLAAENPDFRLFSLDSGGDYARQSSEKGVMISEGRSAADPDQLSKLCGDFCVWLTSPEQDFLRGRFLWCNWDARELAAMKAAIGADPSLLS